MTTPRSVSDLWTLLDEALRVPESQGTLTLAVGLCAQTFSVPMAAIAVPSGGNSWINYIFGLDPGWRHRELPFVRATFGAAPAVRLDGSLRAEFPFFASVILRNRDEPIGVLAIMDRTPHPFTVVEERIFAQIASVIENLVIELACGGSRQLKQMAASNPGAALAVRFDFHGQIIETEGPALGYPSRQLIGRSIAELIHSPGRAAAMEELLAQLGGGAPCSNNLDLLTADGRPVPAHTQTRLAFKRGQPVGLDLIAHDKGSHTGQPHSAEARELFSEHLRQLVRLATQKYAALDDALGDYLRTGCHILRLPFGMVIQAVDGKPSLRAFYPPDESFGPNLVQWAERFFEHPALVQDGSFAHPGGPDAVPLSGLHPACYAGAPINAGEESFGALVFFATRAEDVRRLAAQDREVLELMAGGLGRTIFEDRLRREAARLTSELAEQAGRDPLTGLANRLRFMKQLESALAHSKQTGGTLAVAFLDLDRFKQVNDTMGHAVGDELLRQVALRLQQAVGADESVARVGGDEFTILFDGNPTRDQVAAVSQKLLDSLRRPYPAGESELFIMATIGISFFPEDGREARDLLQQADAAMYGGKSQGKNEYRFFTPDIVIRGSNRMELETELRRALQKEELAVSFMPLVNVQSAALDGLEALLTWNNPRFGRVGPSRFIPIAEESGMIIPIGAWVLREVCRQAVAWRKLGLQAVRVAINVSPLQFARADFVDTVAAALQESGLPPQSLELELTESMIMRDLESAARRMTQLREVGVSIAIDDFGTGYSSLSYLRRLPVDSLKIDQSFVSELGSTGTALPLIHTIVVLAHNFGLQVVAEGVETQEQLELLRAVGCDKVQGHLYGPPLTASGG